MKSSKSLRHLFLATTCLLLPTLSWAQAAPEPTAQPEAEAEVVSTEVGEDGRVVETVVVRGKFIPEPMRTTSEVASFLSNADLERQGDGDAAAALTRLTGLSVVSEGFVYVRGLGDRYSSALLNGSPLPSPEPLRRQVPLNLFPSNILNSAAVQKTFSPNYPGEFGGGIIDLKTLRTPAAPFLTAKISTGGNTKSTQRDGFYVRGSDTDWAGFDDGLRDVPGPLADAIGRNKRIVDANFTQAELEKIGESLVNSPLTVIQQGSLVPDIEGEVTAGRSFDVGSYKIGLVGVVGYNSEQRLKVSNRTDVIGGVAETQSLNTATTLDVVFNAFGSASILAGDNEITLSGLLIRSSTKDAQVALATDINLPTNQSLRKESSAWYERELSSIQLNGEHTLGNFDIKWRGSYAQSTRSAPYEREITYSVVNGVTSFQGANLSNATRFSELTDEVASAGVDVNYTFELSEQRSATISGGVTTSKTDRDYALTSFAFTGPRGFTPVDVLRARVDFLFSPDNIDPRRWVLNEQTGKDDAYKGQLENTAAYLGVDADVTNFIRAAIGFRYEDATQKVATGNRFGEVPSAPVNLSNNYILPAATVTWNFADDLQLRLGYSQTIARPQFRELAFTPYIDPETDRIYQGNPFLTDSEFQNYDARLEYYFGRGQFITGGAFYKKIENPIEEVIVRLERTFTRFINAPEATLYGVELEYRTSFEMPFLPVLQDATWIFSTNYTYTKSEVNAGAGSTVISPIDFRRVASSQFGLDGTQLQGTPEHIANLQFGYETDEHQLTALVGYVSERIARRGLGALPSVLEDPGVNLDLVYRRNFTIGNAEMTFGLSGRNLLDTRNEEYQISALGRTEVNTYDRGRTISMSLSSKW
mgnify:CR=1 FL=1